MCPSSAPDPARWDFGLTDEDVREFQRIVTETTGQVLSFFEAKTQAAELMDLFFLIHDPAGWRARQEQLERGTHLARMAPQLPPDPVPFPAPIRLNADHLKEVVEGLAFVKDELHWVRFRPTTWRYAVVGLYTALGHAFVLILGSKAPGPGDGLHHLTRLYQALVGKGTGMPDAVEQLETLRVSYLSLQVSDWKVEPKELPGVFTQCLEILRTLVGHHPGRFQEGTDQIIPRLLRILESVARRK